MTETNGPRCTFGRPHTWAFGAYVDGELHVDFVKCGTCGRVEKEDVEDPRATHLSELKDALRAIRAAEQEVNDKEDDGENYGITLVPTVIQRAYEALELLIYKQHHGWAEELAAEYGED